QHAVLYDRALLVAHALAIERLGALPANAVRIVDNADARREHRLAHELLEKAHAARDGGTRNRPREMPQQPRRNSRIEHHRHALRFHAARIEPLDRAFASALAD